MNSDTPITIAYLSQGKLCWKAGSSEPQEFTSKFGEEVRERAVQIHRRHSWKTEGRGAQFMSRGLLWGPDSGDPGAIRVAISSIAAGLEKGDILYTLDTGSLSAVLCYRPAEGSERRLLHGSETRLNYISASRSERRLACSISNRFGHANIAVMNENAGELTEVTGGDSFDLSPAWVPGRPNVLIYQSAGVARTAKGDYSDLGCFVIQELDMNRGEVRTLAESERRDLLGPRMAADGTLYCISRPKHEAQPTSVLRGLLDIALLPLRLLYALFQYLNFFTARYTGKPLTTAGGPKQKGADIRRMMVWGNLINADEEARKDRTEGDESRPVVPRSWKLIRKAPAGGEQTLADGVLSFDLAPDGSIVYSTGNAIYRLTDSGERTLILKGSGIEQVVVT
jgi:hypothetical protein